MYNFGAYRLDQREPAERNPAKECLHSLADHHAIVISTPAAPHALDDLAETHQLAWFEALLTAAAIRSGCLIHCSEDHNAT